MYTYLEMQLHPISSASYCLSLILVGSEKGGGHGGKQAVKGCFSGVLRKLKVWQLGESKAGGCEGMLLPPFEVGGQWISCYPESFSDFVYCRSYYHVFCFMVMPYYLPG